MFNFEILMKNNHFKLFLLLTTEQMYEGRRAPPQYRSVVGPVPRSPPLLLSGINTLKRYIYSYVGTYLVRQQSTSEKSNSSINAIVVVPHLTTISVLFRRVFRTL